MRLDSVDEKLADVVRAMAEAFEFACSATSLADRILNFRETVDELLQQTIDCSCHVEQCISTGLHDENSAELVNKYKARFLYLKEILDSGIASSATALDGDDGVYRSQLLVN